MSDPVKITLIVCATVAVIMLSALGISVLEKRNEKKDEDSE
jgi:hypothetical protein